MKKFNAIFLSMVTLILSACASAPTPLQPGEETQPPYGCIEYRKRGGRC